MSFTAFNFKNRISEEGRAVRIKQPAMVFLLAPKSPPCSPKETSKDRVINQP